ncbi:MAG: hypothetical protein J6A73_03260 [Lachnospiraceae bacterium]|nr:hypothetical protein [Lachnospiraceae bacterium]
MSYIGKWKFHSIGTVDDETYERVWLNGEEYMNSPMPYIDETDEKSVADEMKERKKTVGMLLEVCEDGNLYVLMPLPEGVSKEEIEAAVEAGVIKVRDGMMTDDPFIWEERDGELWVKMGRTDDFMQFSGDDEFLTMVTTRFERLQ